MEYYISVLRDHYADFAGRARRREFWMFALINFVISLVLGIVLGLVHMGPLSNIYSLAVLVPSLALGARRLHDTDRSGWWQLVGIIPIVGWIILIIWCATDSQPGDNKYGPNPKGAAAAPAPAAVPPVTPTTTPTA